MRELVKGHVYDLDNLKGVGVSTLQFYQDPKIHGGLHRAGPSTQEVIRACIARVKSLDEEQPWEGNQQILFHLRSAIGLFECRALMKHIEKGLAIEDLPVGKDGHISGISVVAQQHRK